MRYYKFSLVALLAGATVAPAQEARGFRPEIRPFVGVFVPTGALRDEFKTAEMFGAQAAIEMSDNLHVLGTVGFTHGHNKFAAFSKDVTYIWQYDVGVELNLVRELGGGWLWRPLAGVGGGGRTYDYQAVGIGMNTCAAGYGALGTELEKGIVALRLEGRDYLTCFESPMTGKKKTRNDAGFSFGIAYHFR